MNCVWREVKRERQNEKKKKRKGGWIDIFCLLSLDLVVRLRMGLSLISPSSHQGRGEQAVQTTQRLRKKKNKIKNKSPNCNKTKTTTKLVRNQNSRTNIKQSSENRMPICIECGQSLAEITKIENGVRVLANCSNCQSPSDAFAEMDGVQTSIALMLLHKKAYRHTLFNVPILLKPLIILVVLSCVLESYVGVVQNSYLSFFRENRHLIFSSGDFANVAGPEGRGGGGGGVLPHSSAPMLQLAEGPGDRRDPYTDVRARQKREYKQQIDDLPYTSNHANSNINTERDAIRRTGDNIVIVNKASSSSSSSSSKGMGSMLKKTLKKTALKLLFSTGDVAESSSPSSTSQAHSSSSHRVNEGCAAASPVSPTSSSLACTSTTTTCAYIPAHKGEDALGGTMHAACGRGTDAADSAVEEGQKCQNQALVDRDYSVDEDRANGASGDCDDDDDAAMAASARAAAIAAAAITTNQTLHFVKRFLTRGPSLQLVEVVRQHQLLKIVPFFTAIPKMLFFQLLEFVFLLAVLAWVGTALITRVDYPTIASTSSSSPDSAANSAANSAKVSNATPKVPAPSAPFIPNLSSSKNESFASSSRSPSKAPSSSSQQSSSPAYIVTHNKSYTELLRVLLRVLAISSASKLGYLLFLVWDMPFYLVGLVETYQFIILFAALRGARASFRAAFCATFMCLCAKYFFRLLMKSLPPFLASVSFQIMFMRA